MNNNDARFFLKMNFRSTHTSANTCFKNAFRDTWPAKRESWRHYQDLLEYRPEYGILLTAENEMIDDSSLEKSINIRRQFSSSSNRVSEAINTYKLKQLGVDC